MDIRNITYILIITSLFVLPVDLLAKNCKKGQPCGNSCISWSKKCHIGTSSYSSSRGSSYGSSIETSSSYSNSSSSTQYSQRIPKVYIVIVDHVDAYISPNSQEVTGGYKKGDKVLVYHVLGEWARLTNTQPNQWVQFDSLKKK